MVKKILQFFTNVLILTTTLSLCFWMLYYRIVRKEFSIALTVNNIHDNYAIFLNFFICSIIIIILLLLIIIISGKNKIMEANTITKSLLALGRGFDKYNIFYRTYNMLFNFIGHCRLKFLVDYGASFIDYSKKKSATLIIIFVVLPRIIIILIFIFELYTKQLHYYFYSLVLLVLPLLFRFFLFILKDLPSKILPEFNKLLDITVSEKPIEIPIGTRLTPNAPKTFKAISIKYKPEYSHGDLNSFMRDYYNPMQFLGPHMEVEFMPLYSKINKIMLLIYMLIQASGWGYILFYLI